MHARPIAIAITVVASALLLVGPPSGVNPVDRATFVDLPAGGFRVHVPREGPRPSPFPNAQPCLVDTVSCLELSPEPFAPCLLAVERCSGEWRLHPLVGRNAALPNEAPTAVMVGDASGLSLSSRQPDRDVSGSE